MATTYTFKAMDLAGVSGPGRGRGRVQAGGRRPAQGARPGRRRHRRQVPLQGAQPRAVRTRQGQGPGGRVAAARDDGHLGNADPARALRARAADRVEDSGRARSRRSARTSRRVCCCRTRWRVTPRSSVRCTSRWCAPARPAVCSRSASCASPTSSRRTPRCAARCASAMIYPALVITFAVGVLLALVAFLIPVFEGVFKQFGGKLPGADAVHGGHVAPGHQPVVPADRVRRGRRRDVPVDSQVQVGAPALGRLQAAHPDEDRRRRPEGRDRPLVADAVVADLRRRADPAGDRDHRQDRRQRGDRAVDGAT